MSTREGSDAKQNGGTAPVVDQPWFVVDGLIVAGIADPDRGTPVCDCYALFDGRKREESAAIAQHIAKVHNTDLARRVVERKMGVRD